MKYSEERRKDAERALLTSERIFEQTKAVRGLSLDCQRHSSGLGFPSTDVSDVGLPQFTVGDVEKVSRLLKESAVYDEKDLLCGDGGYRRIRSAGSFKPGASRSKTRRSDLYGCR